MCYLQIPRTDQSRAGKAGGEGEMSDEGPRRVKRGKENNNGQLFDVWEMIFRS